MSTPIQTLTLTRPDDWHLHLRDGQALAAVLPHTARQFARAIVMPNLRPPVINVELARQYRDRIMAALPPAARERNSFEPLLTLYLTDNTTADEIERASASDFVHAVKLYPAGATTNSDSGVTDIRKCYGALEAMQRTRLPLLIHGEVTREDVDVFDREKVFIDTVLEPLRRDFPALRIVFEHITTKEAAQYVAAANDDLGATITAHHLLYNRNSLFKGGMQPHYYCLPVLKRQEHREALLAAATGPTNKFFLGTDSAPHPKSSKADDCGCAAGCYTAWHAMELYAQAFESVNALDKLEAFASFNGPDFYRMPRNTGSITLERKPSVVPASFKFVDDEPLIPLRANERLDWTFIDQD